MVNTMKQHIILVVIILLISSIFLMPKATKDEHIELHQSEFVIEYGTNFPTHQEYYVKSTSHPNVEIKINNFQEINYPNIGTYSAQAYYQQYIEYFTISVIDTTKPTVKNNQPLLYNQGDIVDNTVIMQHLQIEDLQPCTIEYDQVIDYNVENQIIDIKITDASSNILFIPLEIKRNANDSVVSYSEENIVTEATILQDNEFIEVNNSDIVNSLVWYNEWSKETYGGNSNIQYGFSIENKLYGGLILKQNPYNIQFDNYQFIGGKQLLNTNAFTMTYINKQGLQVHLGELIISSWNSITMEKMYEFYSYIDEYTYQEGDDINE